MNVYNLRVSGAHTYFVHEHGKSIAPVWVHNADYEMSPDAVAPEYKEGWPGDTVGDHRLSRAIAKIIGADASSPSNLNLEAWATNARKGGLEGAWIRSYFRYRNAGLTHEQTMQVLWPELQMLTRDAHPVLRPNDALDEIPAK